MSAPEPLSTSCGVPWCNRPLYGSAYLCGPHLRHAWEVRDEDAHRVTPPEIVALYATPECEDCQDDLALDGWTRCSRCQITAVYEGRATAAN